MFIETLSPNCWFENVFSPYFYIEISKQNLQVILQELIEHRFYFLVEGVLHIITFVLSWCMHIQNNITPMTSYCHTRVYPKKFLDWLPGARTANGTALCH
jgi:hypothetical protein